MLKVFVHALLLIKNVECNKIPKSTLRLQDNGSLIDHWEIGHGEG